MRTNQKNVDSKYIKIINKMARQERIKCETVRNQMELEKK